MVIQSMSRSNAPLLASVGFVLAVSAAPLAAQKSETIARRMPRASTSDTSEARLRRLERSIDSMVRVFREDELSPEQRFRLRSQIDERFAEFMAARAASSPRPAQGNVFFRTAPEFAFETRVGDASTFLPRMAQGMVPGWIGIVVGLAPTEMRVEGNELFMRYLLYPEITSVDPSSPAQRAGLARGDTLVAYNGRDVRREEISMTKLIVPRTTVRIRVRRDGKLKELPVVVAEVPYRVKKRREDELLATRSTWYSEAPMPPVPMTRVPPPSIAPTPPQVISIAPAPRAFPSTPVIAPLPPVFTISGVAGAQLASVSPAMRRSLGLPAGVLVTQVPHGSPADESGLEEGDIILRVGQQSVTTVRELRDLVARAADDGERSVTLELRRGKAHRTLTLRWRSN
jgi:membrane-associated protease RseP (regulator of RpoE activity)